jgi:hypothetical protein
MGKSRYFPPLRGKGDFLPFSDGNPDKQLCLLKSKKNRYLVVSQILQKRQKSSSNRLEV